MQHVHCRCFAYFLVTIVVVQRVGLSSLPRYHARQFLILKCDDFAGKIDDLMENAQRNRSQLVPIEAPILKEALTKHSVTLFLPFKRLFLFK